MGPARCSPRPAVGSACAHGVWDFPPEVSILTRRRCQRSSYRRRSVSTPRVLPTRQAKDSHRPRHNGASGSPFERGSRSGPPHRGRMRAPPSRCRGFVAASGFGGPAVGAVGWVGPRRVMGLWYGNPRFAPIVKRGAQPPPPAVSRGASIAGNNQRRKLIGNQGRTHP